MEGSDRTVAHLAPGEGESVWLLGDLYTFKAVSEETGGAFALWETESPPEGGPPPHLHHREDETFYVLEGEMEFWAGGETIRAGAGSFVHIPRGTMHTFKNVGTTPARFLGTVVPGGFEKFFLEVGEPATNGSPPSAKPAGRREARRHRREVQLRDTAATGRVACHREAVLTESAAPRRLTAHYAPNHTHHDLDGLLIVQPLLPYERAPGLEVERVTDSSEQQLAAVRRLTKDEHLSAEFATTWPRYDLDEKTRALLTYATKLTEDPNMVEGSDIEALRSAGWDERGIYEAAALVSFFNFSGQVEAASGLPMDRIPAGARFAEGTPTSEVLAEGLASAV